MAWKAVGHPSARSVPERQQAEPSPAFAPDHSVRFDQHESAHSQPAQFAQYTSLLDRTITSPSGGRFQLAFRRVLGVGAYGVVYLAEEIQRDERRYAWFGPSTSFSSRPEHEQANSAARQMYAVKVIRCAPKGSRQRTFQAREVALHRRADGHPGIVPLYAVYGTGDPPPSHSSRKPKAWSSKGPIARNEDNLTWDRDAELSGDPLPLLDDGPEELVYMVLAYVGGGDLFTMITEQRRYIGQDALVTDIFLQLLDAVSWCHDHSVSHRDLKPENVLCDQDGQRVVISDFGLATTDRWSRDFGCGSRYYMSPECYGNPKAVASMPSYDTLANDIWTLGVVLVNLTTGRNPWEAASPSDPTFASYCADPAGFLTTVLPITAEANTIFARMFERDPSRRCSLAELRELVLRVNRWTLRGSELDGACESAKDIARGCGLLNLEAEATAEVSQIMAQQSRFSEDTVVESQAEGGNQSQRSSQHWYDLIPQYTLQSEHPTPSHPKSSGSCSCSRSWVEMSWSRPASRILSQSPKITEPGFRVDEERFGGFKSENERARPESIPRLPQMVQGWEQTQSPPSVENEFERGPKLSIPRDLIPGMPGSDSAVPPQAVSLHSSFQSRIPRYTGMSHTRTEGARCTPIQVLSPAGIQRKRSAPLDQGLHSNSAISLASSESSGFPLTPIRAEMAISSPTVVVPHPSDGKLWEPSMSSGQTFWSGSCDSRSAVWWSESSSRRAFELEPGAPLYDSTRPLLGEFQAGRNRSWGSWGASIPCSVSDPRRRYHMMGQNDPPVVPVGSRGPGKVKRVPVPPIPNELLEEHQRSVLAKAQRVADTSDTSPSEGRIKSRRLLAWFRGT